MKPGNAIMIALGKAGPKKPGKPGAMEEDESSPEMEDEEEGEVSEEAADAASEFADAIKSGDGKLIALAFKNLMKEC